MSTPLVTVGIPFYNNEKTLLNAIRSIFSQTFEDWELILVDDGSTDGSLEIARSVDDRRVRLLPRDGRNLRLSARLNQINTAARGEFIARMDADDMSHPQRFARQLEFLDTHKNVNVVGTSMYILNRQIQPTRKITVPERHEVIVQNKFKSVLIAHASVMAKAEWFRRWPYNEKCPITQDQELWIRSTSQSILANISEPLYLCNEFAATSLSKYLRGTHIITKNIMRYGPSEIGYLRSLYYAGIRYAKAAAYMASTSLGLRKLLVQSRYSNLSQDDRDKAKSAIETVMKTEVPLRRISRR